MWAAAAGQLQVPGTELLISGATAAAVAQALLHHWSAKKLGWVLHAPRQAAAAALDSFLAASPRLKAWVAEAAAAAEAGDGAATLAGRRRPFAVPKRADDAMVGVGWWCRPWVLGKENLRRTCPQPLPSTPTGAISCRPLCSPAQARGKLHKAALQFALEGSAVDVLKAALVSTAAALAGLGTQAGGGGQRVAGGVPARRPEPEPERPSVALVLGHSLVLCLPGAFIAAAHGGDAGAAAAAVAGAVQRGLARLRVGRAQLAAPLPAAFTAGRTLHLLDQLPVAPAAVEVNGAPAAQP